MTPKQKLKIRFTVFSSIIFAGLIILLFLCEYNMQIIDDDDWIPWAAYIIGTWFWFDKKLLYFLNYLIISLLLSLSFLLVVVIFVRYNIFAPIPLASVIGRVILNKKLDTMRKIDLNAKDEWNASEDRAKMMAYSIITAIITCIINFVIEFFI
jgi:hypothetical protein